MSSIWHNKIWNLVELPKNQRALPYKWAYRLKEMSDSTSSKYKAKLVAMGFRHEHGINLYEIFLLVVKMTTLHFQLGVVATKYSELI